MRPLRHLPTRTQIWWEVAIHYPYPTGRSSDRFPSVYFLKDFPRGCCLSSSRLRFVLTEFRLGNSREVVDGGWPSRTRILTKSSLSIPLKGCPSGSCLKEFPRVMLLKCIYSTLSPKSFPYRFPLRKCPSGFSIRNRSGRLCMLSGHRLTKFIMLWMDGAVATFQFCVTARLGAPLTN